MSSSIEELTTLNTDVEAISAGVVVCIGLLGLTALLVVVCDRLGRSSSPSAAALKLHHLSWQQRATPSDYYNADAPFVKRPHRVHLQIGVVFGVAALLRHSLCLWVLWVRHSLK